VIETAPLARSDGLIVQELDGELLVYDLERHRAHRLSETAAFVWRRCEGEHMARIRSTATTLAPR
jgi:coenzyme PQQ synthesis protein D (PqqD)